MAKSDTWMAFYVGDYLSDTLHLAREHHGSYLLLILAAFKNEGWLPGDDASLALIAKCTGKQWKAERHIYARFFAVGDDRWTHNRVTRELEKSSEITAKRQKAGLASAAKRQQTVNTCSTHDADVSEQTARPSQSQPQSQETGAKAPSARRSKPDEQRINLPPDFRPTEDDRHHAIDNGGDPDASLPFFLDHYTEGKGRNEKRTLDGWHRRFRLWCTRDAQWKPAPRGGSGFRSPPDGGDVGAFARAAAILGGGKLV